MKGTWRKTVAFALALTLTASYALPANAGTVGLLSGTTIVASAASTDWTDSTSLPTEAGSYRLTTDVTLSSTWSVNGVEITIDLNGHGIYKDGGTVIEVIENGSLTINDTGSTTHYFNVADNGKATNINNTSGTNSFTGGYITGGTGTDVDTLFWGEGGGIWVKKGTLTMNGGNIIGNTAGHGSGVEIYSGTFTMNGGKIMYNQDDGEGAAVTLRSAGSDGSAFGLDSSTTASFVMNGGEIVNNHTRGIGQTYCYGGRSLEIHGGTIKNNTNGGVACDNTTLSGNVDISDNSLWNLHVYNNKTINISGALTNTTPIGVHTETEPTESAPVVFTSGLSGNGTAAKFASDRDGTCVKINESGEAYITPDVQIIGPTVTAPTAKTLTYTGSAQALVNAGTTDGGTLVYSLSESGAYSENIPSATNAGSYQVWYKVNGNDSYNGTEPQYVAVDIARADVNVTAPTAKTLAYTGSAQALVNAGRTDNGTLVYSLSETGTYSENIPSAASIGNYTVYYKVVGDDNYNGTSPVSVPVSINAGSAKVTVPAGAVIEGQEAADGVYSLACGKTYSIYSDETLFPDVSAGLDISTATNKAFGGKTYNYKYTVEFADTIVDGTEITFAHKHAAKAFSTDADHTDTDKVWAYCEGEPSEEASCVAYLDTDGTYYYGDAPTVDDVILNEYFGAVAEVTDFYFTRKGDTSGAKVSPENMVIGENYVVNATIAVTIDNKVSNFAITRDIVFAARPLEKCDIYLAYGENETKLNVVDGAVTVPADKFTYNGEAQNPVILIKNDVLGTETVLTEEDYTDAIKAQTDAGNYTAELTAVTGEGAKYTGTLTVNWSIAKATAEVTAEALDNIIYDGKILDETDFDFTDEQGVLESADAEISISAGSNNLLQGSAEGVTLRTENDWAELDLTPGNVYYWGGDHVVMSYNEEETAAYIGEANQLVVRETDGTTYLDAYVVNEGFEEKVGEMALHEGDIFIIKVWDDELYIFDTNREFFYSFLAEEGLYDDDDLTSAGDHNAKITITSRNYEDIELNVPVTINKRSVTLTPDADQRATFGEAAPTISYTVEEQNDTTKTGIIASDLAEGQTAADFFGDAVKVGTELQTTNILNPADDDAFNYDAATNDAGTYGYKAADKATKLENHSSKEYAPFYSYYNYGWSAQVYTAEELGNVTDINSLAYYVTDTNDFEHKFDIYLLNTDKTALTSDDVTAIDISTMAHVYSTGDTAYTFTEEWNEFDLAETFTRSANDNLLVVVVNNTGRYNRGLNFAAYSADDDSVWYEYQDDNYSTPNGGNVYEIESGAWKTVLGINGPIQDSDGIDPNSLKNYDLTIADGAFFTVDPKDIASDDITITLTETEFNYDGTTRITAVDSITFGDTTLVEDDDYTVGGTLQKAYPGSYQVQAAGQGNYTGIAYAGWTINAIEGGAAINVVNDGVKTYDGEDISELFTVDLGDIPASKATVTTEYYEGETKLDAAPVNAGNYTVKVNVTAKGYNPQNLEADLTVEKAEVTVTGTLDKTSIIYSDTAPTVVSCAFDGILDAEKADFEENTTVDWTLDEETKQFTGIVSTTDEYSSNYSFTVVPVGYAVASKDIDSKDISVTYNAKTELAESGWTICDDITVLDTKTGETLTENVDYTINGNTSKKPGEFTIEIIGIGNYTGIKELPWSVVETEDEADAAEAATTFTENAPKALNNGKARVICSYSVDVEDGYTIEEMGLIYNNDGSITDVSALVLDSGNASIKTAKGYAYGNIVDNGSGVLCVAYAKVMDANGKTSVVYSNNIGGKYSELMATFTKNAPKALNNGKNRVVVSYEAAAAEGCEITEQGLIYSNDGTISDVSALVLDSGNASIKTAKGYAYGNIIDNGNGVIAVAYAKVTDPNGNESVIYSGDLGGKYTELIAAFTENAPTALNNGKNRVVCSYSVVAAEGYTIDENGLIYCNDGTISDASELVLESDNASIKTAKGYAYGNIVDNGFGVVAVAYAKVTDSNGNTTVVYSGNLGGKYSELQNS